MNMENKDGNIKNEFNSAASGLNMDQSINQVKKGQLTYALNASVENVNDNSISYQNEQGNEFCLSFPKGFVNLGNHFIQEQNKHIFFLKNPITEESEIGYMINNDCVYRKLVNDPCLNFDINFPIHKIEHRITNCSTELYWPDNNGRRYLDIDNIPRRIEPNSDLCNPVYTNELDCNRIKVHPNFKIPKLKVIGEQNGGENTSGTIQFAIQYCDSASNPLSSYYSITNPYPIADVNITTADFSYNVGVSPVVRIENLETTGLYKYFNLAVIKKINNIPSVELVGTYFIDNEVKEIIYSGQNVTQIKLSILDIFEKYPIYELADDITSAQDILIWKGVTSIERINYQSIANKIQLQWETYKIPSKERYKNGFNAANLRQYLRDEVYAFEFVPILKSGKQCDGFHIPGRVKNAYDLSFPDIDETNPDFIGEPEYYEDGIGYSPYYKIYNTARVLGNSLPKKIGNAESYQYGDFGYVESVETYPCNEEIWGELSGQRIRHHKMPDVNICPIIEKKEVVFNSNGFSPDMEDVDIIALGIKIDPQQVRSLINSSNLTQEQKDDIVGFKIIRGDRGTNKSIIAKGILRNVGEYERDEQKYIFPNYPYNDLSEDPFLNSINNAFADIAKVWLVSCIESGEYEYGSVNTNKPVKSSMEAGQIYEFWSTFRPITKTGKALIGPGNYDVWYATSCFGTKGYRVRWSDPFTDDNTVFKENSPWLSNYSCFIPGGGCDDVYGRVEVDGELATECSNGNFDLCRCDSYKEKMPSVEQGIGIILPLSEGGRRSSLKDIKDTPLVSISENNLKHRQIFNSPETSFGQPFLGNVLKIENVIFGGGKAHFVEVKKNAKYKLISKEAQIDALNSSDDIGRITNPFNATAMFTAYQAYLTIYINGITRRNYAYQFNSISNYNYYENVPNNEGIKQRELDLKQYLIPGVQSVGDNFNINNYQRESSVYLRTDINKSALPFPSDVPSMSILGIKDKSRFTIGSSNKCSSPGEYQDINVVSYYASIKNVFENQWGQIYSYDTVDTGYQVMFNDSNPDTTIFGGDTFIGKYTFKTKLPLFIDNKVGAPDDSDIFYDEIGNIAYPKYWHSARSILENYTLTNGTVLSNFISYKAHNFDCGNDPSEIPPSTGGNSFSSYRTYYDGIFYLFVYGIPNFYCESSINLDLRQAFNNKEGEFWPHVSTDIPDDWLQESFVSIANDNTYYYNVTYSTQNKENTFTHLPNDWKKECFTNYPFRAIYSDVQQNDSDNRVNNWLIYRATSYFDFPQNFGKLTSLDGIENKAILARFENKSLLYNNLLTIDTSNPQAAYFGNPSLFKGAPPIDFSETDLGHIGSQHKMLLKIPQGQITIDAKRGQVFLISGTKVQELSAFGLGLNTFFTNNLPFLINKYFPEINVDNHFNGIGLHGVYDSRYNRVIITKLDYIPLSEEVKYDNENNQFYVERLIGSTNFRTEIYLNDEEYFCNKSWTVSFNFNTNSWISFHSYLPNWYIGENNFFYSGINGCCSDDEDFSILIGENTGRPDETTTTSTTLAPFTTSSTTTIKIDCDIEGTADIISCELEGEAIITVEPTPTTTICNRPEGLNSFILIRGYIFDSIETDSTVSQEVACNTVDLLKTGSTEITVLGIQVYSTSLSIGSVIYDDNYDEPNCNVISDGWYITEEGVLNNFIYHVENGVIIEIADCICTTITTTTLNIDVEECCSVVIALIEGVYYNNTNTSELIQLPLEDYSSSIGIAITKHYLFTHDGSIFKQWDITLNPFTSILNTTIAFPIGFTTSSGIVAIDDYNIIAVDDSTTPSEVVELFVDRLVLPNVLIKTVKFSLQVNRIAIGNLLLTNDGKLILINKDSISLDNYLTQYDYNTGTIELDINIGTLDVKNIYECNCSIYLIKDSGEVYLIEKDSPNSIIEISSLSLISNILSVSQISECVNTSLIDYTTTTTTTTI